MLHQLRSGGVLEAVRIAAAGFPNRMAYEDFYLRYRILFNQSLLASNKKQQCHALIQSLNLTPDGSVQFGHSKIFLKSGIVKLSDL